MIEDKLASILTFTFSDDGIIPNNPNLPLLVYKQAFRDGPDVGEQIRQIFEKNGWERTWRWTVYDFPHYHSNSHEVLGVALGVARIRFGGEHGETIVLERGDVVVIPAGVSHQRIEATPDFEVIGAYPPGEEADLCTDKPGEHSDAQHRIASVHVPQTDPVFGQTGPLCDYWKTG